MTSCNCDIVNANVVTLDDRWTRIPDGFIRIRHGRIDAIGSMADFVSGAAPVYDVRGFFVFPGLINTHTHSFQTLTRGIGEGLGVWDWFSQAIDRVVGHLSVDDARVAGQVTALEAIMSGTTTVVDYNYPHPQPGMAEATIAGMREVGVRTILARGIIDAGSVHADIIQSSADEIAACRSLAERFHRTDVDRVRVWFAPYTIFSTSPKSLVAASELAREFDSGVTIHATTPSTLDAARELFGSSDIAYEESIGFLGPRTLLVHCTHPSAMDLESIARSGCSISHNPISNAYLGEGLAPLVDMREHGITVSLGSDGPASNNNQDMLQVMKVTGLLHKLEHRDPAIIMARDIVWMATRGGATSLGWGDDLGSIEIGKLADLFVLNPWLPNSVSFSDPYSLLVFSATQENVTDVFVQGEAVLTARQPTGVPLHATLLRAQHASRTLLQRSGIEVR